MENNLLWRLTRTPIGLPEDRDLELIERPLERLPDGAVRTRNLILSIDPTIRLWMNPVEQSAAPIGAGEVVRSFVLGRVCESRHSKFRVGDVVMGLGGWEKWSVMTSARHVPQDDRFSLADQASVLGMTGASAYFGLLYEGRPQPGEVVVVSAAAGAVGSIVGQIAKIQGCRAVGIAGGEEKCERLVQTFGFDAAVDYKQGDLPGQLAAACPDGIDIGFENVGGPVLDAVLSHINDRARIVLCGLIGSYNEGDSWQSVSLLRNILFKRAQLRGFLISTYWKQLQEANDKLRDWILEGRIHWEVDVLEGLQAAPDALRRVLEGRNRGKQLVALLEE